MSDSEPMIEYLYNSEYGQFSISNEAMEEYNRRISINTENKNKYTCLDVLYPDTKFDVGRKDPILIEMFKDANWNTNGKINGKHAKIALKQIPKRFSGFIHISEQDGKEEVEVDEYEYNHTMLTNHLTTILYDTNLTSDEKIKGFEIYLPNTHKH